MKILVQPTEDRDFLNRMVNRPEIFPHITDDRFPAPFDLSRVVEGPFIVLRVTVDGVEAAFALIALLGAGTYELHSGVLPEFRRGGLAFQMGRAVIEWVMTHTNCTTLTTWAWGHAKHVRLLCRIIGFKETGREEWPFLVGGERTTRINYSIPLMDWIESQNFSAEESSKCLQSPS
jgi:GNAT superfamily N-acetyltransferase